MLYPLLPLVEFERCLHCTCRPWSKRCRVAECDVGDDGAWPQGQPLRKLAAGGIVCRADVPLYMLTNSFANSSLCRLPNPDSSQYSSPRAEDTRPNKSLMHKKRSMQRSMPPHRKGHCGKHAALHAARIKEQFASRQIRASSISSLHHTSVCKTNCSTCARMAETIAAIWKQPLI